MKALAMRYFAASALAIALAPALAQSQGMGRMEMKGMPMHDGMQMKSGRMEAHRATGVVTEVGKNKVKIDHGPVQSLNWPAMTMGFTVKDSALLGRLTKGKQVDFEFVQQGKEYVITSVK